MIHVHSYHHHTILRRHSAGSNSLARICLTDSTNAVLPTTSSFEAGESSLGNDTTNNDTTNGVKELTEDNKDTILCSEEFKSFLGDTARVLERALNERSVFDILLDYRFLSNRSYLLIPAAAVSSFLFLLTT